MKRISAKSMFTTGATALGLVSSMALSSATGAQTIDLDPAVVCAPNQDFTLNIDNRFLPLSAGSHWVLGGREQGQTFGLQVTVLDDKERFHFASGRVATRVVEEKEWQDVNEDGIFNDGDVLIEVALNYFAQAEDGTVCYFGEDVDFFHEDGTVTHEGSWRADVDGSAPGIFMPGEPEVGMKFPQEVAPGIAEDEATIVRKASVKVPAGMFHETVRFKEFNPLDGDESLKVYAADVGIIMDDFLELLEYKP